MFQFLQGILRARKIGRLSRLPYFLALVIIVTLWVPIFLGIYIAQNGGLDNLTETGFNPAEQLLGVALIYPFLIVVAAGRLNDIGINGWWSLLLLGNLLSLFVTGGCTVLCNIYMLVGLFLMLMPGRKTDDLLSRAESQALNVDQQMLQRAERDIQFSKAKDE